MVALYSFYQTGANAKAAMSAQASSEFVHCFARLADVMKIGFSVNSRI